MLDPFSRGAIVALTAVCVAGAFEVAPIPAHGFFDGTEQQAPRRVVAPGSRVTETVAVRRDPFAEPVSPNAAQAAPPAGAVTPAAPDAPGARGRLGTLPSNLIGDTIPTLPGQPARITAIVTGAHPFAMVESGGNHQIKGIGDRVDGVPIVAIDIEGIRLQNGGRLGVDPAAPR